MHTQAQRRCLREHGFRGAVLAGCIYALKHHEQPAFLFSIEPILKLIDFIGILLQGSLGVILVGKQVISLGGTIIQVNLVSGRHDQVISQILDGRLIRHLGGFLSC